MKKWMAGLFLAAAVLLCLMVPQQIQGASSYDKVLYFRCLVIRKPAVILEMRLQRDIQIFVPLTEMEQTKGGRNL
ncbi:Sporulation-specific extracellular nuclease [Bacillus subtilis subsp. subtilis]|nr:Sporulation-specific extracellular nuclease [Bacillus subtilis subsp. subtilis]